MRKIKKSIRNKLRSGYTLIEALVAVSIFAVGSGLIYSLVIANMGLAAKNTSLNNSNSGVQQSYFKLLQGLEGAVSYVDCATYNQTAKTFTAVANGTWANSIRFMRPLSLTPYILPNDNSGYTTSNPPPPTRNTYYAASASPIYFSYNNSLYSSSGISSNVRLYLTYPNVTETVTTGPSPGVKPGLGIASFDFSNPSNSSMRPTNAIGAGVVRDCNHAFLMVESAFAVTTDPVDGRKTLIYFKDTNKTSEFTVICQILDSANQTQTGDSSIPTGGTAGTFSLTSSGDTVQALLPVRDRENNNFLARDRSGNAKNSGWININTKFRQRQDL